MNKFLVLLATCISIYTTGCYSECPNYDNYSVTRKEEDNSVQKTLYPVNLVIDNSHSCLKIENASIVYGGSILMTLKNECHGMLTYYVYKAQAQTANGLFVQDDWSNLGTDLYPGDRVEVWLAKYRKFDDERIIKITVFVERAHD